MTAAEAAVRDGGVIIMCAATNDGHGGESFYRMISNAESPESYTAEALSRSADETLPDQWEAQIFFRVISKARVIYISDAPDELITALKMIPAHSLEEALAKARVIIGGEPTVNAIPDGVSVIVERK